MLEWSANLPRGHLNKLEESVLAEVSFCVPEEFGQFLAFHYMYDRGSSRGFLVVSRRPVCLPHAILRVLQLAGTIQLPPGSVNRPMSPQAKGT